MKQTSLLFYLVKNLDHIKSSEQALDFGRHIGGKEGFLVGISSAAAIYAAIEVAKKLGQGKKVLALAPDNGERYLSTALYEFDK